MARALTFTGAALVLGDLAASSVAGAWAALALVAVAVALAPCAPPRR